MVAKCREINIRQIQEGLRAPVRTTTRSARSVARRKTTDPVNMQMNKPNAFELEEAGSLIIMGKNLSRKKLKCLILMNQILCYVLEILLRACGSFIVELIQRSLFPFPVASNKKCRIFSHEIIRRSLQPRFH